MELKGIFTGIIAKHTTEAIATTYWDEIEKHYTHKNRHYHNLSHLQNMLIELLNVKGSISDWDNIIVALCYHDIIYDATSKNNEEKSAALCTERLTAIGYPEVEIQQCSEIILATKYHNKTGDTDTDLFTDADLSVLGKPWPVYEEYYRAVRKEYCIYPDILYKPGRKKALQHFLDMEYIFKTQYFRQAYETIARKNLQQEIIIL